MFLSGVGGEVTAALVTGTFWLFKIALSLLAELVRGLIRLLFLLIPLLIRFVVKRPDLAAILAVTAVAYGRLQGWAWPNNLAVEWAVVILAAVAIWLALVTVDHNRPPRQFKPGKVRHKGWVYEKKADQFTRWEKSSWERQMRRQAKPPSKATTAARKAAAKAERAQAWIDHKVAVPQRPAPDQDPLPFEEVTDKNRYLRRVRNQLRTWNPDPPTRNESN